MIYFAPFAHTNVYYFHFCCCCYFVLPIITALLYLNTYIFFMQSHIYSYYKIYIVSNM